MKEENNKNKKIWLIIGGVVILAVTVFVVYKTVQNSKDKKPSAEQKPTEKSNKPSQTSLPETDLLTPFKEEELERYLLEKRLDLKKYFVFSLSELKTWEEAKTDASNVRSIHPLFSEHLMQIASSYLEKTGEKIINNRGKKIVIRFLGSDWENSSVEWMGERLDKKITDGKEKYIIFEKWGDKFLYLLNVCQDGKKLGLGWSNGLSLRMENPTTHFFQSKKEVLEFLKNNDPALALILNIQQ